MKIFNWVHKKFHHKLPKDGVIGNGKNMEPEGNNDMDIQGFLSQVSIGNGIDHAWRDGILTIGTFGFDPLKPFINNQSEYTVLEDEDGKECKEFTQGDDDCDKNDEDTTDHQNVFEEKELNPLLFTTFGHSFEGIDTIVAEPDVIEMSNEITTKNDHEYEADNMKGKGERVTLAELFKADGDDFRSKLVYSSKVEVKPEMKKMKTTKTKKGGMNFAKKIMPRDKDEATPIKNVQRLMRRMLKMKIHPADLDVKKSTTAININVETDASESVSLLQVQGTTSVH